MKRDQTYKGPADGINAKATRLVGVEWKEPVRPDTGFEQKRRKDWTTSLDLAKDGCRVQTISHGLLPLRCWHNHKHTYISVCNTLFQLQSHTPPYVMTYSDQTSLEFSSFRSPPSCRSFFSERILAHVRLHSSSSTPYTLKRWAQTYGSQWGTGSQACWGANTLRPRRV